MGEVSQEQTKAQEQMDALRFRLAALEVDRDDILAQIATLMRRVYPTKTVTEKAVMGRLNRKLAHVGQVVRKGNYDYGHYALVDFNSNGVVAQTDDLEGWAREEGVLTDDEVIEA